jgi:hypothetical protein
VELCGSQIWTQWRKFTFSGGGGQSLLNFRQNFQISDIPGGGAPLALEKTVFSPLLGQNFRKFVNFPWRWGGGGRRAPPRFPPLSEPVLCNCYFDLLENIYNPDNPRTFKSGPYTAGAGGGELPPPLEKTIFTIFRRSLLILWISGTYRPYMPYCPPLVKKSCVRPWFKSVWGKCHSTRPLASLSVCWSW